MPAPFEITAACEDRGLLTLDELRKAAGDAALTDAELTEIGFTVADTIANWCKIAHDGQLPATLLQETVVETFDPTPDSPRLALARRFIALGEEVAGPSGSILTSTDYAIDRAAGMLTRKAGASWRFMGPLVVTYKAGFPEPPFDLKSVARNMVARRSGNARDPMMSQERIEIPGVRTLDRRFWVDTTVDAVVTPAEADILRKYESFGMA